MSVSKDYLTAVMERIAHVRDTQLDSIQDAARVCADTILGDNLVFTFGTGHGGFAALEMFPRTGTITGFRPIVDTPVALMHHVWGDGGTFQYRFLHSRPGYGSVILKAQRARDGDALILFSHSGINNVILDMALEFKEKGRPVIAVTSIPHSSATPSRHESGKRLFEVADIVIDNCGVPGDALLDSPGGRLGPTSTFIGSLLVQALATAVVGILQERGVPVELLVSNNV